MARRQNQEERKKAYRYKVSESFTSFNHVALQVGDILRYQGDSAGVEIYIREGDEQEVRIESFKVSKFLTRQEDRSSQ